MQTTVPNKRLFELEELIQRYNDVKNAKVMYMLARETTIIRPILEDIRLITKPTEAMKAFDKARIELAKEHADKDDKGRPKQEINPMTRRPQYVISKLAEFDEIVETMAAKDFPQAKPDREEIEKRGEEILEEEATIDFYGIHLNKIPGFRNEEDAENGIFKAKDMALLMELGIILEPEEVSEVEPVENGKKKVSLAPA